MAPLAGKPPFSTDEPDSFYESPPQPRPRPPKPQDPNQRSSAYDVYENYLDGKPVQDNRVSGIDALGMGLLNMADDSDDDDDDDDPRRNPFDNPKAQPSSAQHTKHAVLAAATAPAPRSPAPAYTPSPRVPAAATPSPRIPSPPTAQRQPQAIAAPRPGYAAPITALNLAIPPPVANLQNPFNPPPSPSPSLLSSTPHPLQPPMTPITPVFARPSPAISFSEPIPRNKPIMRGNNEETLLPNRGEKGDDFWRRFSMIAKVEGSKSGFKQSTWLRKTEGGSNRLRRWVWIVAVVILVCIAGAIGLGIYLSHNSPDHQQPTVLGGSANERATATSASQTQTAKGSGSSVLHVSPTHTVARRVAPSPVVARNVRVLKKPHKRSEATF